MTLYNKARRMNDSYYVIRYMIFSYAVELQGLFTIHPIMTFAIL